MEEKISQKAHELGFTGEDIELIYNTYKNGSTLKGWQVVKYFPGQEKELKKLENFILNYEYDKEIDNFEQMPILAVNMIDR